MGLIRWLKRFVEEKDGTPSSIRAMNFLIIFGFLSDYFMHIVRAKVFSPDYSIVAIVMGIIGLKVWQKRSEK